MKKSWIKSDELALELEFIECEQAVKELRHVQYKYTKNAIKVRVESINKFFELLRNAQRSNNPRLIQLGCMVKTVPKLYFHE